MQAFDVSKFHKFPANSKVLSYFAFNIIKKWTRSDCEKQVKGIQNAKYKKFMTVKEANDYISYWKTCTSPCNKGGLSASNNNSEKNDISDLLNKSSYPSTVSSSLSEASCGKVKDDSQLSAKPPSTKRLKSWNYPNPVVKESYSGTEPSHSTEYRAINLRIDAIERRFDDNLIQIGSLVKDIQNLKTEIKNINDTLSNHTNCIIECNGHSPGASTMNHFPLKPSKVPLSSSLSKSTRKFSTSSIDDTSEASSSNKRSRDSTESESLNEEEARSKKKKESTCNVQIKDERQEYMTFILDTDNYVNVYTDGACTNNGRKDAKAGIGIWFGDNHPLNISRPVIGPPTNNTAEIQAARVAVELAIRAGITKLKINTDSEFLIKCMSIWIKKWKKNNWTLSTGGPVKNKEELTKLDNAMSSISVIWNKIPAHQGIQGNEEADRLAVLGAKEYRTAICYHGFHSSN